MSIILFLPHGQIEVKEDDIRVDDIYIGLETTYAFDSAFGTSLPCNINVACDEGIGWDCQISSVCKIITGDGACTGSLVNNDCCDLTPYVLTADHCLRDVFENLNDLGSYSFRFNYQSPQCNPSQEPNPSQWIVFNGSQFRSSWDDTDFGLLELFEDGIEGLSYSGWNREVNPPTNEVTCIHHPSGDVKKIAVNSDGVGIQGNFWNIQQFDAGLVEPGSSGSPLFDENQLIIGDLSGGDRNLGCDGDHGLVDNNTYGQLSISWNGGGAANSRLIDWLGASTNPNTIDCMDHPSTSIEGPEVLCTDPQTYTLVNNMPCAKTVTWRVEPANLFASPSSGNGVTASLWGNATSSGPATLIYTLSAEGCNDAEVEYDLFVGRPCTFELYSFPTEICVGERGVTFLNLFEDCLGNYSSIEWDFYGAISGYGYDNRGRYTGITTGTGYVCVTVTNDCGPKEVCDEIIVKDRECGFVFDPRNSSSKSDAAEFKADVFPNPANEIIEVACSGYVPGTRIAASLISTDGKVVRELEKYSQNFKVDMADLPSGLYVLQLNTYGVIYHEKIVKL